MSDPLDEWMATPDGRDWVEHVRDDLIPKLKSSAMTISLVPEGDSDLKFAVELGLSIMFDKPLLLVVKPGQRIPSQLVKVADEIVEIDDYRHPTAQARLAAAMRRMGVD